jgi:GrpB-like predicted nucleotidyltransferase (UPF0157 family)
MIEILAYDPHWPVEFEQIAAQIRAGLGDLAVQIDHIGSTAVPGLAAKNIIDIQVSVNGFDPRLVEAFASLGYKHRADINEDHQPAGFSGPAAEWEKRYFQAPAGQRRVNIHVRVAGHANQRYALLFRDYLRSHPAAAADYGALKLALAAYHPDDLEAYTLIKDPVCDVIIGAAEDWALTTGWRAAGN